MGHSTSRHNARAGAGAGGDGEPPPPPLPSRFSRFRTRLRLRRRDRSAAAPDCSESGRPAAVVAADEFAGIARIRIVKVRCPRRSRVGVCERLELRIGGQVPRFRFNFVLFDFGFLGQADMRFKDKFFACLSLGERTYRTETSDKFSNIFSIVLCAVLTCLSGSRPRR
jgi:phosphatidylserine decarboxylase